MRLSTVILLILASFLSGILLGLSSSESDGELPPEKVVVKWKTVEVVPWWVVDSLGSLNDSLVVLSKRYRSTITRLLILKARIDSLSGGGTGQSPDTVETELMYYYEDSILSIEHLLPSNYFYYTLKPFPVRVGVVEWGEKYIRANVRVHGQSYPVQIPVRMRTTTTSSRIRYAISFFVSTPGLLDKRTHVMATTTWFPFRRVGLSFGVDFVGLSPMFGVSYGLR